MMGDKLKPCPFCGGKAAIGHSASVYLDIRVYCKRCGAETGMYTSEIKAANAWNRRAIDCDKCQFGAVPATDENMAKRGWVRERKCRPIPTEDGFACEKCGEWWPWKHYYPDGKPRYCPNCGAKVVEE